MVAYHPGGSLLGKLTTSAGGGVPVGIANVFIQRSDIFVVVDGGVGGRACQQHWRGGRDASSGVIDAGGSEKIFIAFIAIDESSRVVIDNKSNNSKQRY